MPCSMSKFFLCCSSFFCIQYMLLFYWLCWELSILLQWSFSTKQVSFCDWKVLSSIPAKLFFILLYSFAWDLQNSRMVMVARRASGMIWSNFQLKQGHPEHVVQESFEDLQEWRLHSISRQTISVLHCLCIKEMFLMFGWNVFCSSLCPLPFFLALKITKRAWKFYHTNSINTTRNNFRSSGSVFWYSHSS